jgi:Cu(I)/Ag(I) efflux system membrane fusion protein
MSSKQSIRLTLVLGLTVLAACHDAATDPTAPSPRASSNEPAARQLHEHGGDEIAYYTCSMHTSVRSETPGNCPICGMKLIAVTREEVETGVITIDAQRRQTIGVTIEPVARRPLTVSVRAVGKVVYDDSRLADVTLKLRGWIGELYADTRGQLVRQGEPLFTLYSPELYAAQEELLSAAASQKTARGSAAPDRADYLVEAARRRLRLWDIGTAQIDRILRQGKALEYVPIASPVSGYVVEKNVVEGSAVEPGALLFRIAGLDQVWVEAEVYESDLGLIENGDAARVTLPYAPGRELQGEVSFVYPYLNDATRTGRVRIELSNTDLALKPDMYANVELEKPLGELLAVPEDAVLHAGLRNFVFVDLGEGRLRPKAVVLGRKGGDFVEVREGLAEGDRVVTSGTFLVAAESRLKRDMEHWQ